MSIIYSYMLDSIFLALMFPSDVSVFMLLWWWGGVLGAAAGEGVNTQLPGDRHSCQIISGRVIS